MNKTLCSTPRQDGFFMPGEFTPQQAVWLAWPERLDNWRLGAQPAQRAFAAVAQAIAETTTVYVGVSAKAYPFARQVLPEKIRVVELSTNDAWLRDTGPTIVVDDQGERRAVSWQFNAWGGLDSGLYFPWDQDQLVAHKISALHGFPCYQAPFVLEGGAIHVDGEGTLITTEECLLNPNRNPNLNRTEIEGYLKDYLGIKQIIWLPEGVYNDETSGHIDNLCCFTRPGEVLLSWTDDQNDPQYSRSVKALEVLSSSKDAQGRSLIVHKIPQPGPLYMTDVEARGLLTCESTWPRQADDRLAASYINFLITNQLIVMPFLDPQQDDLVQQQFQAIFPDHRIVGVPAREILLGGGNIHCITQQIPAGNGLQKVK
ncbi:agmatine deiminase [Zooshikella harenae]|uniref:Putative agmatine deiminase n=1 Tax=Zooshikella harenae TaxID=2827238 RepID=A0ABS5ZGT3_9GAMM|nr:agmatine deiminase [Zooshikella harenae]MBU2713273.1 agmatine deiminase [Zooshikella harenae]